VRAEWVGPAASEAGQVSLLHSRRVRLAAGSGFFWYGPLGVWYWLRYGANGTCLGRKNLRVSVPLFEGWTWNDELV
jgi:hypothetical protein